MASNAYWIRLSQTLSEYAEVTWREGRLGTRAMHSTQLTQAARRR